MAERTCSADYCESPPIARGLCHKHYMRLHRTGSLALSGKPGPKPRAPHRCLIEGCTGRVKANMLCGMHAQRVLRYGTVELPPPPTPPSAITCRGCSSTLPRERFSPGRRVCKKCTAWRNREWRIANRDALRTRVEAYRLANRELLLLKSRSRYAPKTLTQAGVAARIAYYGGLCWICRTAPWEHLDHVKPLSKGGPNLLANIRPACAACNLSKGSKWPFAPARLSVRATAA